MDLGEVAGQSCVEEVVEAVISVVDGVHSNVWVAVAASRATMTNEVVEGGVDEGLAGKTMTSHSEIEIRL